MTSPAPSSHLWLQEAVECASSTPWEAAQTGGAKPEYLPKSGVADAAMSPRNQRGHPSYSLPKATDVCSRVDSQRKSLARTILQGTVKGGRRQGRQKKRWEDNIREWTGLEFGRSQRALENRGKWRKLVAKSSVVPQRPSRLRDR